MHWLDGCSKIRVVGGYFSGTLEGGRMGDILECFGDVLGLFLTGFQKFERKLQKRIIRQQRYLEVIRNCVHGLFADYEQSVVADEDVAWLREHNNIENPPTAGSLANRKRTSSRPAAN